MKKFESTKFNKLQFDEGAGIYTAGYVTRRDRPSSALEDISGSFFVGAAATIYCIANSTSHGEARSLMFSSSQEDYCVPSKDPVKYGELVVLG